MTKYGDILRGSGLSTKKPLPGQVPNNAGGAYYEVDPWEQLDRFLTTGSQNGTYYVRPEALTKENAIILLTLCERDAVRVIARIVEISMAGRAAKRDTVIFALALVASCSTPEAKGLALAALPSVARTGTDILMFVSFSDKLRGWGRGLRDAVARWFTEKSGEALVWQALKYYNRNEWTLRDLLRMSHPKAKLVVLAAAANRGSVADPKDPLSFGVSGFDSAAPGLIMGFIRKE
jgi:60 kDa SS-A/Ro ribonucleoprotein